GGGRSRLDPHSIPVGSGNTPFCCLSTANKIQEEEEDDGFAGFRWHCAGATHSVPLKAGALCLLGLADDAAFTHRKTDYFLTNKHFNEDTKTKHKMQLMFVCAMIGYETVESVIWENGRSFWRVHSLHRWRNQQVKRGNREWMSANTM
ncbi:hypothetical protein M9458_057487, partial [Cirrhinus mrigala]